MFNTFDKLQERLWDKGLLLNSNNQSNKTFKNSLILESIIWTLRNIFKSHLMSYLDKISKVEWIVQNYLKTLELSLQTDL